MRIEDRLADLGCVLPDEFEPPPGFQLPFEWVRVRGNRVYVSGHANQNPDGSLAGPFGKVPSQVPVDAAVDAAHGTVLSMLASIRRAIGDLERISAWLTVAGRVNADPGFHETGTVIDGFSDFVVQLFGPEVGAHARTAIGVAALPFDTAVVISAELEIDG